MNLPIRFSRRLRTFAVLLSLLAGVSLTANAKDQTAQEKPAATTSKKPVSAKSKSVAAFNPFAGIWEWVHEQDIANSKKHVSIEGAFGFKLGEVFTPKKGQQPIKDMASLPPGVRPLLGKGMKIPIYEVTPPKPIKIFQHYFIFVTPKSRQIWEIVGRGSYKNSKITERNHRLLENVLQYKYRTKDSFNYFHNSASDGKPVRGIILSDIHSGAQENQIMLAYSDQELWVKTMSGSFSERMKKAGIDPSAL